MPPKNDNGTLMTKAHGQLTTRNMSALEMPCVQLYPRNRGLMSAIATAAITTTGV